MSENYVIPDGFGAVPDSQDDRDFKFSDVMGAAFVDWDKGYEIEAPLKVENQGSSLSCVGQTFSKYAEILDWYEERRQTDLSAKDIYASIRLPEGGAQLRDATIWMVNSGVCEERLSPSYDHGNPPTDDFFKNYTRTQEIINNAKIYASKEYRSVYPDIEEFALAIQKGYGLAFGVYGCNGEWSTAYPTANLKGTIWGHAIFGVAFFAISDADDILVRSGKMTMNEARKRYREGISQ